MSRADATGEVHETRHRGGRYLDSSRDLILREATLALLAEVGYDRLTMDAVAARARAGKTTIYRRWPGKAELVVDSVADARAIAKVEVGENRIRSRDGHEHSAERQQR